MIVNVCTFQKREILIVCEHRAEGKGQDDDNVDDDYEVMWKQSIGLGLSHLTMVIISFINDSFYIHAKMILLVIQNISPVSDWFKPHA